MTTLTKLLLNSGFRALFMLIIPLIIVVIPETYMDSGWYFYLALIMAFLPLLRSLSGKRRAITTVWCCFFISVFFRPVGKYEMDISVISILFYSIVEYPFLDFKEYNRPVYLAMSKKPMVCSTWLHRFQGTKHWMIVVPGFGSKYYVFHVKGRILVDLKPSFEIMTIEELNRIISHAYRLGYTSRSLLRAYTKMSFEKCHTCQQYVGISTMAMVRPQGAVCTLNKVYGRFTFFILLGVILLVVIMNNWVSFLNLPIDLIIQFYINLDFYREKYPDSPPLLTSWSEIRGNIFAMVTYFVLFFTKPFDHFNGIVVVSYLLHALIIALMNLVLVPSFEDHQKKSGLKK